MTGFSSKIFFAQAHGNEGSACVSDGILRPELFSSRIFVDRKRFDEERREKLSSAGSRGSRVDRPSNLYVVTDMSEVGGSVV